MNIHGTAIQAGTVHRATKLDATNFVVLPCGSSDVAYNGRSVLSVRSFRAGSDRPITCQGCRRYIPRPALTLPRVKRYSPSRWIFMH